MYFRVREMSADFYAPTGSQSRARGRSACVRNFRLTCMPATVTLFGNNHMCAGCHIRAHAESRESVSVPQSMKYEKMCPFPQFLLYCTVGSMSTDYCYDEFVEGLDNELRKESHIQDENYES